MSKTINNLDKSLQVDLSNFSVNGHTHSYLPLAGGTLTGQLKINGSAASIPLQVRGIVGSDVDGNIEELYLQYGANNVIHLGNEGSHTISADGSSYSGNSASATKLKNARTLTIGNTGKTFDGTANVSWTVAEIGAAPTSHNHNTLTALTGTSWTTATRDIQTDCVFEFSSHITKSATGLFPADNNANAMISFNRHGGPHASQLGFSSNGKIYYRFGNTTAITDSTAWQQIYTSVNKPTPSDIGAAASSHGTHVTYSTTAPKVAGTAAAGSETSVSRGDHVHAAQTSVSGNAGTATKLATARNISLGGLLSGSASFDGSANVTINAASAKPPKSGDWWSGGFPTIGTDGVMEVGKYLDFHNSDTTTNDFDVRLQSNTAGPITVNLPSSEGTIARIEDNVASATKLKDARSITIGNKGNNFDGTANISYSLSEIGAADIYLEKNQITTISVGGNADTYYPVVLSASNHNYPTIKVSISRAYNAPAPDTWNTASHRGGLTLTIGWNGSKYWDGNGTGNGNVCWIEAFNESYSTMVAGLKSSTSGMVVWLRGGGAGYQINSSIGTAVTATIYLEGFTDSAAQEFKPRTNLANNADEIFKRFNNRHASGLYDNNNRVYSASNKPSLSDLGAAASVHSHTVENIVDARIKHGASSVKTFAPVATWANSSIKNNDIVFGGDYTTATTDSNIVFSSNTGTVNMVIDGEFYATEGQNKVYHAGNKPTPADIGAAASSHTHKDLVMDRLTGSSVSANYQPGANKLVVREYAQECTDMPSAHWYHIYTGQGSDPAYNTQLAVGMTTSALCYRNRNANTWGSWKKVAVDGTLNASTVTGNLTFSDVTGTSYPVDSSKITWNGSTDGADIFYRVEASDKGTLMFNLRDDTNTSFAFAYNGTIKSRIDTDGIYQGTAILATALKSIDTRSQNYAPNAYDTFGIKPEFKQAATVGLNNSGGTYVGLVTYQQWVDLSNWSGGKATQLAFCDNGDICMRKGDGSGWAAWKTMEEHTGSDAMLDVYSHGRTTAGTLTADNLASTGYNLTLVSTSTAANLYTGTFKDLRFGRLSLCLRILSSNNTSTSNILTVTVKAGSTTLLTKNIKGTDFTSTSQYTNICTSFDYNGTTSAKSPVQIQVSTTTVSGITFKFDYAYASIMTPAVFI